MPSDAVSFRGVSKTYGGNAQMDRIVSLVKRLKAGNLQGGVRRLDGKLALEDVSFRIAPGERIGIIGPNGAGKSTILKLVNGVIDQSRGEIDVRGSVGGLLEVNAGFQPNLTAYENVILNLTFQGFSRAQAGQLVHKVFELAELTNFKQVTFKSLSSGMGVRLGFMTAILSQPDVVLLDEVLAVGDARFRAKCMEMIGSFLEGKTTLFVSHNMADIREVCRRVLVVYGGKLIFDGEVEAGIRAYEGRMTAGLTDPEEILPNSAHGTFLPPAAVVEALSYAVDGVETTVLPKGRTVQCRARLRLDGERGRVEIAVQLKKIEFGSIASVLGTKTLRPEGDGADAVAWEFSSTSLLPGDYYFEMSARRIGQHKQTLVVVNKFPFSIAPVGDDCGEGLVDLQMRLTERPAAT